MAANAHRFARENGLPYPPEMEALDALDEVITSRRKEAGFGPEEPAPDLRDGSLVVLAGAYAGEAAKAAYEGTWRLDPNHDLPLVFAAGPQGTIVANLLGKVAKYLANGESDSVASLVRALRDYVNRP
jgi:hypothetical protein